MLLSPLGLVVRSCGGGGNFETFDELLVTTLPMPLANNVGGGGKDDNPLVLVVVLPDTVGGFIVLLLLFESIGGGGNVDFLLSPVVDELVSPPPSIMIKTL